MVAEGLDLIHFSTDVVSVLAKWLQVTRLHHSSMMRQVMKDGKKRWPCGKLLQIYLQRREHQRFV